MAVVVTLLGFLLARWLLTPESPQLPAAVATELDPTDPSLEIFGWLLVPLGILLYHLVSFRYDHAEDSRAFRNVVERLKPVLTYWGPTPRQEGRVMNQLRLIAAKAQLRDNKGGLTPLKLKPSGRAGWTTRYRREADRHGGDGSQRAVWRARLRKRIVPEPDRQPPVDLMSGRSAKVSV